MSLSLHCEVSGQADLRYLLRVSQIQCCQFYIHLSLLADEMPQVGSPVFPPVAPPGHLTFLHNVSSSPFLRKQLSSKVSMPWSPTTTLAAFAQWPMSSKTALMLACIVYLFFSFTWSLLLLKKDIL